MLVKNWVENCAIAMTSMLFFGGQIYTRNQARLLSKLSKKKIIVQKSHTFDTPNYLQTKPRRYFSARILTNISLHFSIYSIILFYDSFGY